MTEWGLWNLSLEPQKANVAVDEPKEFSFLFYLLLNRFNMSWSHSDKSSEVETYLSINQPLILCCAEAVTIVRLRHSPVPHYTPAIFIRFNEPGIVIMVTENAISRQLL